MLTQHVSSIIMLIVRRTDYIKTACGECLQHGKEREPHAVFYIVCSPDDERNDARNMLS